MRALLLDRLPNLSVATKTDAGRALNGVNATDTGLVQALLKYGTYDAYYFVRESSENNKADEYEYAGRLQPLDLGGLEALRTKAPEELQLFTSSHHPAKFVPFRQFCGHEEWPICGRTHGLSANSLIPSYAWNYFAALGAHDSILCTSSAGKQALSHLFANLESSRSVAGTRSAFPVRMPLMHIDGVEIENSPKSPEYKDDGFVLLSIGRLTASHKADLRPLIISFLTSDKLPPSATLILAGDDTQGHIAAELEHFARTFPGSRKLVVLPDITAAMKRALLRVADVGVCMSDTYQETFGVSVLEAMAAGLPVVAPNWDGYRDIVVHGTTGFLVNTAVYPDTGLLNAASLLVDPAFALGQRVIVDMEQLMHWVALFAKNRSLARQMGQYGKERAQNHFGWQAIVRRLEDCWNEQIRVGKKTRFTKSKGPIGFMDYDRVFQDHPESWLTPATVVQLTCPGLPRNEGAGDLVYRATAGELFSPSPIAGFSEETIRRIIQLCRSRDNITIAQLIEAVQTEASGPSMVGTQVSRLIKYGLLGLKNGRAAQSTNKEHHDEVDSDCTLSPIGI